VVILLALLLVLAVAAFAGALFLLGFRLGGEHWHAELTRVRLEAVQAERQLHDLTRDAFVAMTEAAEKRPYST
jgi:hypothetical protein